MNPTDAMFYATHSHAREKTMTIDLTQWDNEIQAMSNSDLCVVHTLYSELNTLLEEWSKFQLDSIDREAFGKVLERFVSELLNAIETTQSEYLERVEEAESAEEKKEDMERALRDIYHLAEQF